MVIAFQRSPDLQLLLQSFEGPRRLVVGVGLMDGDKGGPRGEERHRLVGEGKGGEIHFSIRFDPSI